MKNNVCYPFSTRPYFEEEVPTCERCQGEHATKDCDVVGKCVVCGQSVIDEDAVNVRQGIAHWDCCEEGNDSTDPGIPKPGM